VAGLAEPGYFAFWGDYLNLKQLFPIITPTWNHLWYVVYLLVYVLLIAPFLPILRRLAEGAGGRTLEFIAGGPVRLIFVIAIPFIVYELTVSEWFPTTHDLFNDWGNHAHRFTIFMLGYFAAKNDVFWRAVHRALPLAATLAIILGALGFYVHANEAVVLASPIVRVPGIGFIDTALGVVYAWSAIVLLMSLAQRFLNRPSKALTYLTGAVFCYYILHQTIIVIAGYYLTDLHLGVWREFALVTGATVAGCAGGYEVSRRVPYLRAWFGIKAADKAPVRRAMDAAPEMA